MKNVTRGRVWILLLFLITCSSMARGQVPIQSDTTAILDLTGLIAEMRASNPVLLSARYFADAGASKSRQAGVLPDPSFSLSYQPLPILTAHGYQRTQWRLEQVIPYPGKQALQRRVADIDVDIADLRVEALEQELVFEIKQAYYDLYRIQEQEKLIDTFQAHLRDYEETASVQYEVGAGSQEAILKAQLERNTLSNRRLGLSAQRQTAVGNLAQLIDAENNDVVSGPVIVERPEITLDQRALLRQALLLRPEAELLRQAREQAKTKTTLAETAYYPDFKVSFSYFDIGKAAYPASSTGRDAFMIGVGIQIPMWRDRLRAGVEVAQTNVNAINADNQALEASLRTQIESLVNRLLLSQDQLESIQSTLIPQAETTLAATLHAYSNGRADFLDLLDTQRLLFNLSMEYEETYALYLKTIALLERTVGTEDIGAFE